MGDAMEFQVLGPLVVRANGQSLPVGSPTQRALFAALLLHANQVVSVERLVDLVWGEAAPRSAVANVRTHVGSVRKRLGPAATRLSGGDGGYQVTVHPGELDLRTFDELVAAKQFGAALALWRGQPFENVTLHGADAELARLSEARLTATEEWLRSRLQAGDSDITGDLRGLVVDYPLREPPWALLMLALHRSGRQADALAAYEEAKAHLAAELGLDPGRELRELRQKILTDDPALLAGSAPAPAQLPPAIADFTGRTAVLRQLDQLLDEPGANRAVVITGISGTAGVGKTALTVHWAHRVRDRFPDGQLFLNLRAYAPGSAPVAPAHALAGFLGALGVPPERIPEDVTAASALFRSLVADRRMLVVLDDAASPDQVRPLFPASPGCAVVINSRDRLDGLVAKDGARPHRLDVLSEADAVHLLRRILGADRVAAEPAAAAELAVLCAGLPLALRVCAAHLAGQPDRSLADHVRELRRDGPLDALVLDGDDYAVRAAFDLSYAALGPAAQRLFRLLGCAPGPDIGVPAAAELAGLPQPDTARLLARLARAHLVETRPAGRYAFHDLLCEYARHCEAEAGERDAALTRLLGYYLRYGGAAADAVTPHTNRLTDPDLPPLSQGEEFPDTAAALSWLGAERGNLIAAVHRCHRDGPSEMTWYLAGVLRGYLHQRGEFVEWLGVTKAAAAAAEAVGSPIPLAAARHLLGNAHSNLNQYPQALEQHTSSLSLSTTAGWRAGEIAALVALGGIEDIQGRPVVAAQRLTRALDLSDGAGFALINLGVIEIALGWLASAEDHFTRAVELNRDATAVKQLGWALTGLGMVLRLRGEFARAVDNLAQARKIFREVKAPYCESGIYVELAHIHADTGAPAEALDCVRTAIEMASDSGDRRVVSNAHLAAAVAHLRASRVERAGEEYSRAMGLATQLGIDHLECQALAGLAAVHQDAEAARAVLARASTTGYRLLEGQVHTLLATLVSDPVEHASAAVALHRATGHRLGEAHASHALGLALGGSAGEPHLRAAHRLFAEIGTPEAALLDERVEAR